MHKPTRQRTTPKSLHVLERQNYALDLRRANQGYRAIAESINRRYKDNPYFPKNYDYRAAWDDVKARLDEAKSLIKEDVQEAVALDLERIDQAMAALWPKVMKADVRAAEVYLQYLERKAKHFGTDAQPKEPGVTVNVGVAMRAGVPIETLAELGPERGGISEEDFEAYVRVSAIKTKALRALEADDG